MKVIGLRMFAENHW